jgi:cytidine deaminase
MEPAKKPEVEDLVRIAKQVSKRAYAPYSGFSVGVVLRTEEGKVFEGANVENGSYSLTLCAERVAMASAVAQGHRNFDLLVLYTPTKTPTFPCGACRQFMAEFHPDLPILLVFDGGRFKTNLASLFPQPFHFDEELSRSSDREKT